jgi:predicted Zn-dependent peptidase
MAEEVDRERGGVPQEISHYDDEPESLAYHAASEVFWPDQALGPSILGSTEILRKTIMAGNYRASWTVLSVSGNIDAAAVLAEAGGQFGGVTGTSDLDHEKAALDGGEK